MSFKRLLACMVVAVMALSASMPVAAADSVSDSLNHATEMLKGFGIVKGDASGDLRLGDTITRAELMTLLVRAAGKESDAALLRGATAFTDTATHWASGYIALAKSMGLTMGYPDGTFQPDNQVTYAEVIAFLDRLAGVDVSHQALTWPNNYIKAAMEAGIIPSGIDISRVASEYALRGYVFLFCNSAFFNVRLSTGKTIYQTYFKSNPPTLQVAQGPTVTTDKESVSLSGIVSDDTVSLTLNGETVPVASGKFSALVKVPLGKSTLTFVATDAVGNTASFAVAVTRTTAGAAAHHDG